MSDATKRFSGFFIFRLLSRQNRDKLRHHGRRDWIRKRFCIVPAHRLYDGIVVVYKCAGTTISLGHFVSKFPFLWIHPKLCSTRSSTFCLFPTVRYLLRHTFDYTVTLFSPSSTPISGLCLLWLLLTSHNSLLLRQYLRL